jgi:hypothetical protein
MQRVKWSVTSRLADWPYLALLIAASLAFAPLAEADDDQG